MGSTKRLILKLVIIAFSIMVSQSASAQSTIQPRIVGGDQSDPGEWEWMVALSFAPYPSALDAKCGATLVSPDWVLTAAHCLHDSLDNVISPAAISAYVGAYDLATSTGESRSISAIYVHPSYDPNTSDNDIALLRLSAPVTTIQPLILIDASVQAQLETRVDDGLEDVFAIGWGGVEAISSPLDYQSYPIVLRDVALPYVSNTVCNSSNLAGQVTNNMMCAGEPEGGIDSCQGDSGGPLVFQSGGIWYQAGVVSWGLGCAQANSYGVYTRVNNYTEWLKPMLDGYAITEKLEYGSWVSGLSKTKVVTIDNYSSSVLNFSSSVDNTVFNVIGNNCASAVGVDSSCDISVEFLAGSSLGVKAGQLTILTDAALLPSFSVALDARVLQRQIFSNVNGASVIDWALSGASNWTEESVTNNGFAFQSGEVVNTQSSSLFAYVEVDASGSRDVFFDWKVCSEDTFDFLELWIDNTKVDALSGNVDWDKKSITLSGQGSHVIEWRYKKDYLETWGLDQGWLDNFELDVSSYTTPVHLQTCNLVRGPEEPAPEAEAESSGGGALSFWVYLSIGMPLLMRRRRHLFH